LDFFDRVEKLRRVFGRLRKRVGAPGAALIFVAIAAASVWWFWDDLKQKPGVEWLVARIEQKPIVPARPGHLVIAVAHLADDKNHEHEKLLRDALGNEFQGAETQPIDRTITPPDGDTEQEAVARAKEEANRLRQRAGADVLLWGKVMTLSGKSEMRLYWTTGSEVAAVKSTGLYPDVAETIAIPPLFWDDLKQVLGVLVQSRIAAITEKLTGHYSADQLAPLIDQVRKLLQARQGTWDAETDAGVRFAFANALVDYGAQTGNNEALRESIAAYRQTLGRGRGSACRSTGR
jgi:hypothetical protein